MTTISKNPGGMVRLRLCWILSALWVPVFLVSVVLTGSALGVALNAIQLILLIAILVVHASLLYGWSGAAIFCAVGFLTGLLLEASSVANGFPFGTFVHHSSGPRAWGVPLYAMLVYMCYGWYAWALARVICLKNPNRLAGYARVGTPLIAAFVLAGFDYPIDPILSTVFGLWTFEYPSGQFGVPLSNFAGWIFAGGIIFSIISAIDTKFRSTAVSHSRSFWLLPCVVWIAQAAQYPILWIMAPSASVTLGSRTFVTSDIFEASLIASLVSVLFVGLLATTRVAQNNFPDPHHPETSDGDR